MAPGCQVLKKLNSALTGPFDTLTTEETPAKRPRTNGPQAADHLSASPYLQPPKSSVHTDSQDLGRSSPLDHTIERMSVSSTGDSSTTSQTRVHSHVDEYRKATVPARLVSRGPGIRRSSRKQSSSINLNGIRNGRDGGLASSSQCSTNGSPDALASDGRLPQANGVSNAQRQSQRSGWMMPPFKAQTKKTQPPVERICDSEDELSFEPEKYNRKTNFSGIRQPRQPKARGDTQHKTLRTTSLNQPMQSPLAPEMVLQRAACGKELYDSDDAQNKQIHLRFDSSSNSELVPVTAEGERLPFRWLQIRVQKCSTLLHAAGNSPCVAIHRPSTVDFDAKLNLEFTTKRGASALVSIMNTTKHEVKQAIELECIMRKAVDAARQYKTTSAQPSEDTNQPQGAGSNEALLSTARFAHETDEGQRPRRTKLRDGLQTSARLSDCQRRAPMGEQESSITSTISHTRARPTKAASPVLAARQPSPERWTSKNPDWRKQWHDSLVFPATGKNRTTVDGDDILRLDEGEFLNDNLISFYLRYLQFKLEKERPELLKKVYIFSTFFFEKLRSTKGKINYEGVKAWTTKFDLFSHDYVVVPVHEQAHWYLAIICNVANALHGISVQSDVEVIDVTRDSPGADDPPGPSASQPAKPTQWKGSGGAQNSDSRQPKIVTLDSLGSQHYPTCKALKDYLTEEARDKKRIDLAVTPNGMKAKEIPQQNNFCDCGLFVLGYVEEFLKDPDGVASKLLQRESLGWSMKPSSLRFRIREILFELQREQQQRRAREKTHRHAKPDRAQSAQLGSTLLSVQSPPRDQRPTNGASPGKNAQEGEESEPKFISTLPKSSPHPRGGQGGIGGREASVEVVRDSGPAVQQSGRCSYFYDSIDRSAT